MALSFTSSSRHSIWKLFNSQSILNRNTFSLMTETEAGAVSSSIEEKLRSSFNPSYLKIINESYQHNVPPGSETHFKVVVVSSIFNNVPLIKRHRLVNEALSEELKNGVHALSLITKTPSQWESSEQVIEKSSPCRGGFGK